MSGFHRLPGETTMHGVFFRLLAAMVIVTIGSALVCAIDVQGQTPPPMPASPSSSTPTPNQGTFLLTIFLRHDQSKTLGEINEHLRRSGYYEKFPPPGIEVVSWYVMMGIGQVVTLRVPPERLREVNRALEETAWGGYRTEFYPTYDYKPIAEAERKSAR
jgi:hypothetical protein